ncbi:MAG: 1-acyl-sn-glycerol-3-phosphate acyltransferase [Paludibacteraceae bacterium]|jgi:1-acyl-sn-glycerol-3-phosphate acyltransferase|nr:1-acyl-sn-glycerol-3-phosphate acyltransferase [Paludibacteraceae bacterium]
MKVLYILYQYLIGFPLIVLSTLFTAVFTIICFPWKNGKAPRAVQVFWSRSVIRLLLLPIKVTGRENVDPKQSYVFVANHQSFLDVFAVYGWLPNNFKWLMKKEIRRVPFVGTACAVAGHIFVDRSNPRAALQSMEKVKKELVDGISTVIFPEGTRTKTGEIGRFKQGAFKIAMDMELPVVPITLNGFYKAMPSGQPFANPYSHLSLHIGKPIDISQFTDINDAMVHVREKVEQGVIK